jgi:hypothetical protein
MPASKLNLFITKAKVVFDSSHDEFHIDSLDQELEALLQKEGDELVAAIATLKNNADSPDSLKNLLALAEQYNMLCQGEDVNTVEVANEALIQKLNADFVSVPEHYELTIMMSALINERRKQLLENASAQSSIAADNLYAREILYQRNSDLNAAFYSKQISELKRDLTDKQNEFDQEAIKHRLTSEDANNEIAQLKAEIRILNDTRARQDEILEGQKLVEYRKTTELNTAVNEATIYSRKYKDVVCELTDAQHQLKEIEYENECLNEQATLFSEEVDDINKTNMGLTDIIYQQQTTIQEQAAALKAAEDSNVELKLAKHSLSETAKELLMQNSLMSASARYTPKLFQSAETHKQNQELQQQLQKNTGGSKQAQIRRPN